MNRPMDGDDERLRALFHDAVSDVEPHDGLADVRRRTRARRTSTSRRWAPMLVGAGAVAATVVAATFVVTGLRDDEPTDDRPSVASSPSTPSSTDSGHATTSAAALYFLANTATGPRLYREFQAVAPTDDPAQKVLLALQRLTVDIGPRDKNYRTLWPADSFTAVQVEDDRILVELGTDDALQPTDEPGTGRLGVQQAVYTAEAALRASLPVAFEWNGAPAREVLGMRVPELVDRDRSFNLTAPVNISDPSEDLLVEDGTLEANGTMATYVRRVEWTLSLGGNVLQDGSAVPADAEKATLGAPAWKVEDIDVSSLAPGHYVFEVTALDVGQTSDSPVEYSDTRTITVR